MNCTYCHDPIDPERLAWLRDQPGKAFTCTNCSREKAKVSFQAYDHKTAGYIVTVDPDDEESLRRARRIYRRSR
jgi:hypothetical protein